MYICTYCGNSFPHRETPPIAHSNGKDLICPDCMTELELLDEDEFFWQEEDLILARSLYEGGLNVNIL